MYEAEMKLRAAYPGAAETKYGELLENNEIVSGSDKKEHLRAVYFDDRAGTLQKNGIAFRLRQENGVMTATVKAKGMYSAGFHKRLEFNVPVDTETPDLSVFLSVPEAGPILEPFLSLVPKPLFVSDVRRKKAVIRITEETEVEAAFDTGTVFAGDSVEKLEELELELKKGTVQDLLEFAAGAAGEEGLLPEKETKYSRGMRLAGRKTEEPASGDSGKIHRDGNAVSELVKIMLGLADEYFDRQEDFIRNPHDPENIHRMRVRMRRLRSIFSLSGPFWNKNDYDLFREKLKVPGRLTGRLRELDIFLEEFLAGSSHNSLKAYVESERQEERRKVLATVSSGIMTGPLLSFRAFLLAGCEKAAEENPFTAGEFIDRRIYEWLRDLRKAGKDWEELGPEELHAIRIKGKKVRYTLESFPGKRNENLLDKLKNIQTKLGFLHDLDINMELLSGLTDKIKDEEAEREAEEFLRILDEIYGRDREKGSVEWKELRKEIKEWGKKR